MSHTHTDLTSSGNLLRIAMMAAPHLCTVSGEGVSPELSPSMLTFVKKRLFSCPCIQHAQFQTVCELLRCTLCVWLVMEMREVVAAARHWPESATKNKMTQCADEVVRERKSEILGPPPFGAPNPFGPPPPSGPHPFGPPPPDPPTTPPKKEKGQMRSNKVGQIRPNKVGQMRPNKDGQIRFGQMRSRPHYTQHPNKSAMSAVIFVDIRKAFCSLLVEEVVGPVMERSDRAKVVSGIGLRPHFRRGNMRRPFSEWRLMSQRCWRIAVQRSGRSVRPGFVLVILQPTLCSLLLSHGFTESSLIDLGRKVCCMRSCSMEGSWMLRR